MSDFKLNETNKGCKLQRWRPLIIAGAGTGKTAVLTQRIISLIKNEFAKPSEILALTLQKRRHKKCKKGLILKWNTDTRSP